MSSAHDVPEPIQWHEGMLLMPQHLQQQSLRHEQLLSYHNALIAPYYWGIRHFDYDERAIVEGRLQIERLEAVMPDGLIVTDRRVDFSRITVDLNEHRPDKPGDTYTVHLAVPSRQPPGRPAKGALPRYESVADERVDEVVDEVSQEGEIRIPRWRPRVSLEVGETPAPKFVSFPLAQFEFVQEQFRHTSFVPPSLQLRRTSELGKLCRNIATRLRSKADYLAGTVRAPSIAARGAQLLEARMQTHAMVAGLPHFEALVSSNVAHPFTVYLALCALIGNLATFGKGLLPPPLEPYDHNDLFATYEQARLFIDQVIQEGFAETFDRYPFRLEQDRFRLRFDPAWEERAPLVLSVRTAPGASDEATAGWVEACLIGSESKIESMRERRVLGAIRRSARDVDELLSSRGVGLYKLIVDSDTVVPGEDLVIFNPTEPDERWRPATIELYVKKASLPAGAPAVGGVRSEPEQR